MSLSKKALQTSSKPTTLNPNAAEFIPFALRSPSSGSSSMLDAKPRLAASTSSVGKSVLDRTESSDEEAHQFWSDQLPDDITPDFKSMTEDDPPHGFGSLPLASLSLHDMNETAKFHTPAVGGGFALADRSDLSSQHMNGNLSENMGYPVSSFGEDPKLWDKQIMNGEQPYSGNSRHGFVNELLRESSNMGEIEVNPLEFLASQFPGFAAESLAEVYFAYGCDLHMTIEMLTQLELQVDGGLNQNLSPKTLSAPNLTATDFPALTISDSLGISAKFSGDDYQSSEKDNMFFFKSRSSGSHAGSIDYASTVRKLASQDSGMWKYERYDSVDSAIGSSRSSLGLADAYKSGGRGRSIYANKLQNRAPNQSAPVWVETGDAVANMYSELREEARDHACLRNAYFEQARQAYLIGNKALAKELSVKGQLHNMKMKGAHGKAQEAIYRHSESGTQLAKRT
ncbi:PREDICTED: polyadenylate-binding protein-interacting protein 7-like isoform X2 [Tarenaya hassleriana]|uniref:polyadenylate-binding protein-interacting protein 7-like isoform X2 n=1 Tax=Tarenaya hassleriana TaxID=28532 RepID=UPI00053C4C71|nr:PREDICTED: polyadenylate-binding protein-interacting protein 7-like isoform X2 [Tarenaya hassleriana]